MLTLNHFLVLGAILFVIGLYGAISKRNAIAVLMGIEIMLNAVNITLVGFSFFKALIHLLNRSNFRYFHYHCSRSGGSRRPRDGDRDLSQTQYGGCWRDRRAEVLVPPCIQMSANALAANAAFLNVLVLYEAD